VTSVSALHGKHQPRRLLVSKAGLAMMTQLYRRAARGHGINVYEIRPGVIETDMTGPVKTKYDELIFKGDLTPNPPLARPTTSPRPSSRSRATCSPSATGRDTQPSNAGFICDGCDAHFVFARTPGETFPLPSPGTPGEGRVEGSERVDVIRPPIVRRR